MNTKLFPAQGGRGGVLLGAALLALLLASCADMFQEKVPLFPNGKPGSLRDVFKQEEEITGLEIPSQLYVAPFYSRSEIRLTWEAVRYAAYYMIERAVAVPVLKDSVLEWETPGDEDYEILERQWYGVLYEDEVLKYPALDSPEYQNRYYYRISAHNPSLGLDESDPCEPGYAMLFRAPSNVRASGGVSTAYIDVRWAGTEDAVSYEVWRSVNEDGASPSLLRTVSSNQNYFMDTIAVSDQGKDFFYIITAKNRFNNGSLQTKPAMGYANQEGAPDSPNVWGTPGNSRGNSNAEVRIEWNRVTDAEYYAVYRYSKDGKTGVIDSSLTRLTPNTTQLFWNDSTPKPGVYYYYRVQAFAKDPKDPTGTNYLKSAFSVTDEDTESYILSPPDTVIAEKNSDGTITMKWMPPIGSETEVRSFTYTIHADAIIDGSFNSVVRSGITYNITDGYICAERVSTEHGQFFRVVTSNGSVTSARSVVVAPSPEAAVILGATQHAFISPEAAVNANGVYPVRITWRKPDNDAPVFYHVQRSTRADGGFSRVNDAPLPADGTGIVGYSLDEAGTYSFIDRNDSAKAGRKYYYRVLSLNQLQSGSFYSGSLIGWGALSHTQYMLEYNKTMKSALKKLTYMNKAGSTEKLGTETKYGAISGSIYYNAALAGAGARIIIKLENYADFYIESAQANGVYFVLSGNSNTSANMSSNGSMDGTMTCAGMYPGRVYYDRIEIKGGDAGGGTYGIEPDGFARSEISWTYGK